MGGGSAGRVVKPGGAIPEAAATLLGNLNNDANSPFPNRVICVAHPTHLRQFEDVPLQGCRLCEVVFAIEQSGTLAPSVAAIAD